MSQNDIIAPILSYDNINKCAEDFLRQHKRNEILPVNIEAIAEFDLGLNIFPFPNLQETFDIEGFISGDLNVIYVDEFIYYQRPARYRFTLAHECFCFCRSLPDWGKKSTDLKIWIYSSPPSDVEPLSSSIASSTI